MKYLIFLLLIIFPFGQLVRVNLGNSITLHPNDIAVFVFLLLTLRKIRGPLLKPLLFFLISIILSLILNFKNFQLYELVTSSLYPVRFFAYAGLFFVFKDLSSNLKDFFRRWLVIVTVIVAITGLAQYIFIPNVAFLSALNWDDHYYRLIGTFFDPGFTGAILVLGLVMSLRGVLTTKQSNLDLRLPRSLTSLAMTTIIYLAMALTYSRASYLMYIVSFGVIAFYKKSAKIFLLAALILGLTIFVLPRHPGEGSNLTRENSILARIHNWQQSIQVWQTSPIFGIGFNNYRYVVGVNPESHSGGADSSILLVLATTGIMGLLSYLFLLKKMWSLGGLIFKASFLGIIIHSFFNNTLFYPWVMEWLWIILATADI